MAKEYEDIGARLKEMRMNKGLTQDEVAEMCKLTTEYYRSLESGHGVPSLDSISKLYHNGWDIDYILIGSPANESEFSEALSTIDYKKRNDVCNILICLISEKLSIDKSISELAEFKPVINEDSIVEAEPIDRIRILIANEKGRTGIKKADFAEILGVSEKTISRLLDGTATLKTAMLLSVYEKYKYAPSYILFGDFNSNSKCDYYYRQLDEKTQKTIMESASILAGVM